MLAHLVIPLAAGDVTDAEELAACRARIDEGKGVGRLSWRPHHSSGCIISKMPWYFSSIA
jgi:hypothetical protein